MSRRVWPSIYQRPCRNGRKGYVVDAGNFTGKKRFRRNFRTLEEAQSFARTLAIQKQRLGHELAGITLEHGHELLSALKLLSPLKISLIDAVRAYVSTHRHDHHNPTVREISDMLIQKSRRMSLREDSIRDLKQRLSPFLDEFGHHKPSEIEFERLRDWFLHQDWKPRNFINYRNKIGALFNFAKTSGYVSENPINRIDKPRLTAKSPEVYSTDECARILKAAMSLGVGPYVCLGLFAGLRPTELSRLDWSAVRIDLDTLTVGGEIAKGRSRRNVTIEPILKEWLEQFEECQGPIVENYGFRYKREKLVKKAGLDRWIQDGLRHSFATYHFARFGDSVKTSREMGHRGTDVFHNYYKALVTYAEAEEFWRLAPEKVLACDDDEPVGDSAKK
jgi:integrase